jgi:PAS domain S-box-containing protein
MWQSPAGPRVPSKTAMLVIAVALFAIVLVLKLVVTEPGWGFPLLYDIPVALVALAYGVRGGLAAAAVGMVLFAIGDVAGDIHSNAAGYASRALSFFVLAGLLGLYADRLRQAETVARRLAAIVEQTEDAVIVALRDGTITEWNEGAERLFGHSAEEAIGGSLRMLVPPDLEGEQDRVLGRIVAGEGLSQHETVRVHKDGSRIEVALTATPLRDDSGAIVAVGSIVRDITERKRAEARREGAERDLARSNLELEQYAYVASHDLQEPLRSIGGFAQLLEERYGEQLDEDGKRFIGFIRKGVARMQSLISDLLSYSRTGQEALRAQRVDTGELVRETLSSLDAAVRDAGAEVEVGALPVVEADRGALAQLFGNLLSNALKFTDGRRPPHVDVSAARDDRGWRFVVADNGLGIDPADAERVFGMFERLHREDEYGGTGVGLAICKRIVERHGGRIWCEPRPAGGTSFLFTLPG